MKKVLLTGFVPFLNYSINPTEQIVKQLDRQTVGNYEVFGHVLSVDYTKSGQEIIKHYEETEPDVVLSLGLAAGNYKITPERIAINCNDGEADNKGNRKQDQPIVSNGPDGLFSTLPIRKLVNGLKDANLPATISNTAGTYLCNHVMYTMLHHIKKEEKTTRSGFVHIPASHELAIHNPKLPSWSEQDLLRAVTVMIELLD
ncbi:pyroglutamyl-peptidase I [Chengkuizengella sediminis]|uniref:pyroglutamyl-peptidase I n=1 Tax=Chengkuizengella sediminis TaxID=1885917 RepID=UPI001389ADFA|nr:pyroglutamyl-peptidase I [Chengkuizengella sediminis]NDI36259.1 pyroglutamyl-peptidase I [Chengkuizengella sediminis]